MKYSLLLVLMLAVPISSFCQGKVLNKFYRTYKKGENVQNLKLPGWLLRFGGKIAINQSGMTEEDERLAKQLMKKAGGVKFMFTEDGAKIPAHELQQLRNDLLDNDFDDLIMIQNRETNFQLMIQEKDGVVKNLVMLFNDLESGEMAFVTMKLRISLDEVSELVEKGMEKHYHEIIEEEPVLVAEPVL